MPQRESVETILRFPRLVTTLSSARAFNNIPTPASTDGNSQYRMRSAMDLHPGVGKWVSRRVVNQKDPKAGRLADATTSRFVDAAEINRAVEGVRRDGFYIFEHIVDAGITSAIREFAELAPCQPRGVNAAPAQYPRTDPPVGRYDFAETVSLQCAEVQEFATDPAMAAIAQTYLGQPVLMDEVAMWWTTTRKAEDANVNAQQFHQDRDRLSFLKFFIYLTDVTTDTGPHVYLKGSHLDIPRSLRGDGRKTDEAVRKAGLWDNVTELCGPPGTLMAVDTIGLHKGKTPIATDRLALENEFSTSLFGMDYELPAFEPTALVRDRFAQMPWALQRYSPAIRRSRD